MKAKDDERVERKILTSLTHFRYDRNSFSEAVIARFFEALCDWKKHKKYRSMKFNTSKLRVQVCYEKKMVQKNTSVMNVMKNLQISVLAAAYPPSMFLAPHIRLPLRKFLRVVLNAVWTCRLDKTMFIWSW